MRIIGMDIHREFAEVVTLNGAELTHLGRVKMTRDNLAAFAVKLEATDHVVLESTGNTTAVVEILSPHVARVAVANPLQVHLIAKAKTKTDKIDAGVLAKLYGAGFLPEVWTPGRSDTGAAAAGRASDTAGKASCSAKSLRSVDPARASCPAVPSCRSLRWQGAHLVGSSAIAGR